METIEEWAVPNPQHAPHYLNDIVDQLSNNPTLLFLLVVGVMAAVGFYVYRKKRLKG